MAFYQPDPKNKQVYNAQNQPVTFDQYRAQGGVATNPNTKFSDVQSGAVPGYSQLPTLNPQTGTSSTPQQVDPIDQFNKNLMELLTRAQGIGNNTALMAQRGDLQRTQVTNSMKPADELGIQGLSPQGMLNTRQNEQDLYNPEIKSLNDRMQLNNESVSRFERALSAAEKIGETYSKFVKPEDDTIAGVQAMLEAGHSPSAAVMDKVGKYIDWNKVAAAEDATDAKKVARRDTGDGDDSSPTSKKNPFLKGAITANAVRQRAVNLRNMAISANLDPYEAWAQVAKEINDAGGNATAWDRTLWDVFRAGEGEGAGIEDEAGGGLG